MSILNLSEHANAHEMALTNIDISKESISYNDRTYYYYYNAVHIFVVSRTFKYN